jgi:hypothetical protein
MPSRFARSDRQPWTAAFNGGDLLGRYLGNGLLDDGFYLLGRRALLGKLGLGVRIFRYRVDLELEVAIRRLPRKAIALEVSLFGEQRLRNSISGRAAISSWTQSGARMTSAKRPGYSTPPNRPTSPENRITTKNWPSFPGPTQGG